MRYLVEVSSAARRDLRRVSPQYRTRIETVIRHLGEDPFPYSTAKVRARRNTWRIRVGYFRIIYEVHKDVLIVYVVEVALRNESTYRGR